MRMALAFGLLLAAAPGAGATPPPIAAFAHIPTMSNVVISPDGERIAYLHGRDGAVVVLTHGLDEDGPATLVLRSPPDVASVRWCRFKTATRLLCGFRGTARLGASNVPFSRLVAVDADGKNVKVLVQNSSFRESYTQDQVLNWLPDTPDRVLIELFNHGYASVYELDVNTGALHFRVAPHPPIQNFTTDYTGVVRLGCGMSGTTVQCFSRGASESIWHPLTKYEVFQQNSGRVFTPLGFSNDPNVLYALGPFEGREALWRVDLADATKPELEFMHPAVDIEDAIRGRDGRLLGVRYDTDRPVAYYLDREYGARMRGIERALPDGAPVLVSESLDGRRQIIETRSDVDAGTFYLFERDSQSLARIGSEYPDLDPKLLGRMQSISYPARDGTPIPGYLTVPVGVAPKQLPLIVMPHGGPVARDRWRFFFLQQFLVSRGYAVLQMNFRGSSGYGADWFYAANQDWGGLTYSDIADATKWAVDSGLADPQRVCIVGWSFGGYAALLAAVRDGSRYRCVVSIAGLSDLPELRAERYYSRITDRQLGSDSTKLKADSPAQHAAEAGAPVLMIHGTRDYQVDVEQSERMAAALKSAKKPHELILLQGEGHAIDGEKARTTLLEAIERFVRQNLGPGAVSPPS
jgi:dipeptidyl aminopeptidase/acylaminoacyl peptidase